MRASERRVEVNILPGGAFIMKRIGNLWGSLVDSDNLEKAARKACASRKDRAEVSQFDEEER